MANLSNNQGQSAIGKLDSAYRMLQVPRMAVRCVTSHADYVILSKQS